MDNSILYGLMIVVAILMAILPFGVFIGFTRLLATDYNDGRLIVIMFLLATIFMFGISLGSFALVQHANCGSIKNMSQISINASIATAFEIGALFLAWLIAPLRNIIVNLIPQSLDGAIQNALGYSYYGFWGALFGIAIGGTFSAVC